MNIFRLPDNLSRIRAQRFFPGSVCFAGAGLHAADAECRPADSRAGSSRIEV